MNLYKYKIFEIHPRHARLATNIFYSSSALVSEALTSMVPFLVFCVLELRRSHSLLFQAYVC
jgi:hypothetical protein